MEQAATDPCPTCGDDRVAMRPTVLVDDGFAWAVLCSGCQGALQKWPAPREGELPRLTPDRPADATLQ